MTKVLQINLLGDVSIQLGDRPLSGLPSRAAEATLIYLAMNDRPIAREKLAELLWADRTQQQALTNLRSILTPLRRELDEYLTITRQTLALNRDAPIWLDVAEFEMKLQNAAPPIQGTSNLEPAQAEEIQAAIDLYQGDFLEGFHLREGRSFEEWATLTRERLRRLASEALRKLTYFYLEHGEYQTGIKAAGIWTNIDPYNEDAARTEMWLLARAGQPNNAVQRYLTLKQTLADDLGVEPATSTREIFERIQVLEFPPPLHLPASVTPFIGRQTEINDLACWLASPEVRLVTIVGPGGIGKTRLSIEIARYFAQHKPGRFFDGIYFVPLAEVESSGGAVNRIAESLDIVLTGAESPQRELVEHLRDCEILLILDNFEHLIDPAGESLLTLITMFDQALGVKLLLTSRERLNLYQEIVFDIQGLDFPAEDAPASETYGAVALFIQNARRVKHHFAPSNEELDCLAQACRLLSGMPLAIELAAGWIGRYSCGEIVEQVGESLDFLRTTYRNVPERHRSLRAVFERSWALLDSGERDFFAQMSIFPSGFTVQAVEAIISNASIVDSQNNLILLVEKSLLQQQTNTRYEVHPLLRSYVLEKLELRIDLLAGVAGRHAGYYLDYLSQQGDGESQEQRAAIREELANIRAAWRWAAVQADFVRIDKVAATLHNFYSVQSWFLEGIEIFEFAIAHLKPETDLPPQQAAVICDLLGRKARLCIHIGRLKQARADLDTAMNLLTRVADPQRKTTVLGYLAITLFYAGDYAEATQLAEQSRLLSEQSDDQDGIAFAWNILGSCAKALGDYEQAWEAFERSVAAYRKLEDGIGAAMVLNNLGNLAQAKGDYPAAQRYYQECSQLFKTHDHIHGAATTLANAGRLAVRQGDFELARDLLNESQTLKESINDQRGIAVALVALGDVSVALGDHQLARAQFSQALSLALQSKDTKLVLDGLAAVADWLAQQEKLEVALQLLTFISGHKATSQETRQRVEEVFARVSDSLPGKTPRDFSGDLEELVSTMQTEYLNEHQ